MKNIFTLIAIAISAIFMAQAPNLLSYQAVIRNTANQFVTNQNVAIKFSILKSSTNGTVVYAETQNTTTNSNGLFTTNIGAGTILSGAMNSINWANDAYFVKSEIDLAGGTNYTITGTQQLLSVPYALNAKNGIPSGGTTNQVLAKVNATDYNTQWVTPSGGSPSATALPNAFYAHGYTFNQPAYYTSPFVFQTQNILGGFLTFLTPAATNFTINFSSFDDEALTFELFEVTPVSNNSTFSTTGTALATCNTTAWSSGAPISSSFSYAASAGKILTIKITKTGGGNLTSNSIFYTAFSTN